MKLERLPEYLSIIVTVLGGIFMALYLGLSAGSGSSTSYLIIGGIFAVLIALALRANTWLLIPMCWPLAGKIESIPGAFPVRDLVILYAFVVFLALKALKVVRAKNQYNWLDLLLFINLIYLLAIFIKNPVGTESMGFDRVGGRPYFEVLILLCGYWVIGHVTISAKRASKFPLLLISGSLLSAFIGFISYHIPAMGAVIGKYYSDVQGGSDDSGLSSDLSAEREGYLGEPGAKALQALYSCFSPITTLNPVYIWRFLGALLATVAILKSGYRGVLMSMGVFFLLSSYFRNGFWSVMRISFVVAPLLAGLIFMQGTLFQLPFAMQRALSFLPGNWNDDAVIDGTASLDWRHDIWQNVWNSKDKYIHDWWFGDGFGMTKAQYLTAMRLGATGEQEDIKESLTISGCFHSLPLTAIHAVGFIGFTLYCILLFSISGYAWKLIRKTKGTPFFPTALLMGVPAIISPLRDLILTGFFDSSLLGSIFTVSILRMISRSLEKYHSEQLAANPPPEKTLPELAFHRFQSDLP